MPGRSIKYDAIIKFVPGFRKGAHKVFVFPRVIFCTSVVRTRLVRSASAAVVYFNEADKIASRNFNQTRHEQRIRKEAI